MKDQTDIVAENERLTAELATATASLGKSDGVIADSVAARDAALKERDDAKALLATVTAERDTALAGLAAATKERDELKAVDRNFSTRLAGELAKHGIRAQGLPLGSGSETSRPFHTDVPPTSYLAQNLTDLCRKA